MARMLLLSNGRLHVGLNKFGMVHDLYFPHVGYENHAAAKSLRHRIGVWVDGNFSWIDDGNWQHEMTFHHDSLVGISRFRNEKLGIIIEAEDAVDARENIFMRAFHIINHAQMPRQIKLFLHQALIISNSYYADTVRYLPIEHALLHYKANRMFLFNGRHGDGRRFDQFTVGMFGIEGHEGSYKDAEDGRLSGNTVEHGVVDSVMGFTLDVEAMGSARVNYWMAAGENQQEVMTLNQLMFDEGIVPRILKTDRYWGEWLKPAESQLKKMTSRERHAAIQSLLLLAAHCDRDGAITASTDTTMLNYSKDSYAFCWPRDASLVLWPLIRFGIYEPALNFFGFATRALHPKGYLHHKYHTDGSLGSSWHPVQRFKGVEYPPIQTDETALVLFVFAQYYRHSHDHEALRSFYDRLVAPMAHFLASYIDPHKKLPLPSYDLWERLYQTTTFTTAATVAALQEAAFLADQINKPHDALQWREMSEAMKEAARTAFYDAKSGTFIKGIHYGENNSMKDTTIDISSLYGAMMFGLYRADSPEVDSAFAKTCEALRVGDFPAVARFVNDDYDRAEAWRVGNPWIITTLWRAQFLYEMGDKQQADAVLNWVIDRAAPSGVFPEQLEPDTYKFVSVAPLAWSQAELLSTLLDKYAQEA